MFEHSNLCLKNASKILNNEIPIIAVGGVENKENFSNQNRFGCITSAAIQWFSVHGPKVISSILNNMSSIVFSTFDEFYSVESLQKQVIFRI